MSVILCNYKDPTISIYVTATVSDGQIEIKGQDIGKTVEKHFGDSDYEYFYSLSIEETSKLYRLLKTDLISDDCLIDLVSLKFSGVNGCKVFREFCERHDLIYSVFTY